MQWKKMIINSINQEVNLDESNYDEPDEENNDK